MPDRRPNTTQRGYGAHHQAMRDRWAPRVATGRVKCWRCGELIPAGAPWDLGHDDHDRRRYKGPEHQACNRGASRRRAVDNLTPAIDPEPRPTSNW